MKRKYYRRKHYFGTDQKCAYMLKDNKYLFYWYCNSTNDCEIWFFCEFRGL